MLPIRVTRHNSRRGRISTARGECPRGRPGLANPGEHIVVVGLRRALQVLTLEILRSVQPEWQGRLAVILVLVHDPFTLFPGRRSGGGRKGRERDHLAGANFPLSPSLHLHRFPRGSAQYGMGREECEY